MPMVMARIFLLTLTSGCASNIQGKVDWWSAICIGLLDLSFKCLPSQSRQNICHFFYWFICQCPLTVTTASHTDRMVTGQENMSHSRVEEEVEGAELGRQRVDQGVEQQDAPGPGDGGEGHGVRRIWAAGGFNSIIKLNTFAIPYEYHCQLLSQETCYAIKFPT